MIKEQKQPNNISPLEYEILSIMERSLKETQLKITKDDIKEIVHNMMPDLDKMIADKIQNHFIEIGEFLLKKFKTEE